ncbi:PaaI family thioesterase [Nonomuraea sp. NBC_01738]|uniref:PaaI family thioesterase n=1 Tax=Nonomuraea sp. NBC_01738 TaxID=2976003 RepID=UPI002E121FA6|nr:PaaI family thioesterase [Nonomuraea sp. NBC_01738]
MTIEAATGEPRLDALCALAQQVRDLMDATATTDADEQTLAEITQALRPLTARLAAHPRDTPQPFEIGPDGTLRHLGNAVTGAANPHALPLIVNHTPTGVSADLVFRPLHEGPPRSVHGGITSMILDHLLGQATAAAGYAGMTASLTVRFLRPVPYATPLVATAEHTRAEGRKSWSDGRVALPDGTPLAEATGLFITPTTWMPTG